MSKQFQKFCSAKKRIFYFFRENEERGTNYVELDSRPLGILRPALDIIVLTDKVRNRKSWTRAQQAYGYLDNQVVWKETDEDWLSSTAEELEEVLSTLSNRVAEEEEVLIVPYIVTPEFIAACNAHNFDYVGTQIYRHEGKSCLYTNQLVKELLNFEHDGVKVSTLIGLTGNTKQMLQEASNALKDAGINKAIFKPTENQSGTGI